VRPPLNSFSNSLLSNNLGGCTGMEDGGGKCLLGRYLGFEERVSLKGRRAKSYAPFLRISQLGLRPICFPQPREIFSGKASVGLDLVILTRIEWDSFRPPKCRCNPAIAKHALRVSERRFASASSRSDLYRVCWHRLLANLI
jgi:hypothetical protein